MNDFTGHSSMARLLADTRKATIWSFPDSQKMFRMAAGTEVQKAVRSMVDATKLQQAMVDSTRVSRLLTDLRPVAFAPVDTGRLVQTMVDSTKFRQAMLGSMKPRQIRVDTTKFRQMVVDSAGLRQAMVDSTKLRQMVVDSAKLNQAMVNSMKLRPVAFAPVDTSRLVQMAVDTMKFRQAMVDTTKLRQMVVDTAKFRQMVIDSAKLWQGVIDSAWVGQMLADMRPMAFAAADTARLVQGVVSVLESAMVVPSAGVNSGAASAAVAAPGSAPLLPGLAHPWEQIRHWDLQGWIVFLSLVVAIVAAVLAAGQQRPQAGVAPEDLERIIRLIQEDGRATSTAVPPTSNAPCSSKPTQPLNGEEGPAPTAWPSPAPGPAVRSAPR